MDGFWTKEGFWSAAITAIAPTMAVIFAARHQKKKLEEIHVLVNSRLQIALDEIKILRNKLAP